MGYILTLRRLSNRTGRPRFLRESIPWRKALRIDELDAPFFTFEFRFDIRERFVGMNRISEGAHGTFSQG